ncbi:PP2C family protein-serine/threonine phosphatase [Reticulibacter mediterranei]|nr:protein phosphatase 2C domain-containing protein [Reticulibacter mediterranei]
MASRQQSSLLFPRNENGTSAQVGFANTQIALLSDTDAGHIATLLEQVQALLNTHGCSKEMKTKEDLFPFMLQVGSRLDRGIVRKDEPNEDSLFIAQSILHTLSAPARRFALFVVADGMGGQEQGQEASQLALESLAEYVYTSLCSKDPTPDAFVSLLQKGFQSANQAIYLHNQKSGSNMGTTMTAILISDSTAYIAHTGDSRAYLYRQPTGLIQLTHDHSLVAALVEVGAIQPEEVYTHPGRNQIYRYVGRTATVEVDIESVPLAAGDRLLLCSDGLWEMVRDPQIADILARPVRDPSETADRLVQAALTGGGEDNVGVIVVQV